jgi:hypothetical protein
MTNSEFIEEILHDAHTLGIVSEVFDIASSLQSSGVDATSAYDIAFRRIVSEDGQD